MMSHLIVSSLCYKNGKVTCVGTANNVEPYEYKSLSWDATPDELLKSLIDGQIQPTKAANDYKWTVLLAQTLRRPKEHQIHFFKYMMNQGPKGNHILRFVDGEHIGKYVVAISKKSVTMSNQPVKKAEMSYYRCWWYRKNMLSFKDCAIVKV